MHAGDRQFVGKPVGDERGAQADENVVAERALTGAGRPPDEHDDAPHQREQKRCFQAIAMAVHLQFAVHGHQPRNSGWDFAVYKLKGGFATSRRAIEDNNLTGYEVYSDSSEGRLFNSHDESVLHTARHLSKNYLKEDSMYYNGLSVDAIQIMYCPDEEEDKRWEEKVDYLASNFLKTYDNLFRVDKS